MIGLASAVLIIFGFGSVTAAVYLLLAAGVGLGLRLWIPVYLGRTLDQATDGAGAMWITLTIRPDGLQIEDGLAASVISWRLLSDYQKSDGYLLLAARGRSAVVVPRAEVSPLFEANLDRMLFDAGITAEPAAPTASPLFRGLQGVLVLALLFLVLCIGIVMLAGGPKRDRVGTCPDDQIGIVTRDSDGDLVTLCQYRLGD